MPENQRNGNHKMSSVNELLPIVNESQNLENENDSSIELQTEEPEEDPALVQTKHDFVTSPWSKLGIIGGAFGLAFLVVFFVFSSMMNSNNTAKKPLISPTPTPTKIKPEKDDGDIYAKLALAKQQEELDALNNKKQEKKEEPPTQSTVETKKPPIQPPKTQPKVVTQETPPPPKRRIRQETAAQPTEEKPRRKQVISQPIPPIRPTAPVRFNTDAVLAKRSQPQMIAKDPIAELERLRGLGSVGHVEYAVATTENAKLPSTTTSVGDTATQETVEINNDIRTRRRNNRRSINTEVVNNTPKEIEELRPRWETNSPTNSNDETSQTMMYSLLPEENQILQETKPQYLVVGTFAKATLITPLMLPQSTSNNNTSTEEANTLRFVAELDESLYSNTGEIAIPAGTKVTIAMLAVDGASTVRAEVTAILKDETEYPVLSGTIAVLGEGGLPLVARPYHNKGPEIAKYDATLAAIAGIAKVGEIINKPDQQTTQVFPLGGTVTNTSGGRRNIEAAFVEGAFNQLSQTVGKRTERATNEIMNRPNIWYVPKNTKITIRVDSSVKL
ncbi:MAG: TrbI/VirB10 family protein [Scytonema sp. PMC 1069.18]|nr:TrbI/VirB10 family protein [Scytonema sp. PMC 1069.18]MEC4880928.1 TrbI/VirB10 family protein [Scytonema sp. PMC 1070.18]